MTKTTNTARIAALEATVASQSEKIEFLLEHIERLADRINRVKRWNREQDEVVRETVLVRLGDAEVALSVQSEELALLRASSFTHHHA